LTNKLDLVIVMDLGQQLLPLLVRYKTALRS